MSDLRLVGLSEDGSNLVLEQSNGDRHQLPVDERIHAAMRGDRARLGQLQINIESGLRPREIQARIRAGQSLDEVAKDAGMPLERVMRYAGPILHEREHIAQEAAKANVKSDDHGAVMLLGELVADRLEERGVSRDSMEWDAWRRDDGGWEVRLDYVAGESERSALWVYDPARKVVTPDDDDARWLLKEEPAASVTQLRAVAPTKEPRKKATAPAADVPSTDSPAKTPPELPTTTKPVAPQKPAARIPTPRDKAVEAAAANQKRTVPDTPPSRKRRAAVPSWDEILFGSRKPE